jgi:hypothetical protein
LQSTFGEGLYPVDPGVQDRQIRGCRRTPEDGFEFRRVDPVLRALPGPSKEEPPVLLVQAQEAIEGFLSWDPKPLRDLLDAQPTCPHAALTTS